MTMQPEIKDKWTTALRSDEYLQGKSALKIVVSGQPARYCCWGVLCEILEIPESEGDHSGVLNFNFPARDATGTARTTARDGMVPHFWAESLGVDQPTMHLLARMNDGGQEFAGNQQTFHQIADYIDVNL